MAHVPPLFPESLDIDTAESLALQACDDIESLRAVQSAYACLEKLIGPQRTSDAEELYPNRTELGALVGLVNEELQQRIDAADATARALHALLGENAVQGAPRH